MKITLPDPRTREGIKSIVRFIVARATSICVVTVINRAADSDEEDPAYKKASVFIGAHVIGEMVADATAPFVDRQIDEFADMLSEAKEATAEITNRPDN